MQHPSERSVDEILKAIQKVIESDNRETAAVDRQRRKDDGVMLNGASPKNTEESPDESENLVAPDQEADDEELDILDLGAAATALIDEEIAREAEAKPTGKIPPERIIAQIEETLTSERAADAMRRSLSNLSRVSDEPQRRAIPAGETSIEQLVRDMLRPMLAQWLDTNRPPLVERMVKDEISRIAGKRG